MCKEKKTELTEKMQVVFCTGMTELEFLNRIKGDQRHFCYLCHRAEGSEMIGFTRGRDMVTLEVSLSPVLREVGNVVRVFEFCQECLALRGDSGSKGVVIEQVPVASDGVQN